MSELVTIVNEKDEVIGECPIEEAREKEYARRIARIFILDDEGRILLQLRAKNVRAHPGVWDLAAAGHVNAGETYKEAAEREMQEEIGVSFPLKEIQTSYRKSGGTHFAGIYKTVVPTTTKFTPDPNEVEKLKWVTIEEFTYDIKQNPENYMPALLDTWKEFQAELVQ